VPLALAVVVAAATWTYLNILTDDAPARLTLGASSGSASGGATTTTTVGAIASSAPSTAASLGGTWKVTPGSEAGYRVKEILFGQSAEAVGRTSSVTGQIVVDGATVSSGSFEVDMTSVTSNESRRDNQFRGRIMDVANHPTSTFVLSQPIDLAPLPADGQEVTVKATGKLTLRGATKTVTVDLTAQRTASSIRVAGTVPIVFSEWGIPNPTAGPAQTENHGVMEFLLVLGR
jgi:polyisoprenoid-binding protein YceI